jgi:hypothetical protein
MKIHYVWRLGINLPSLRFRILYPAQELEKRGHEITVSAEPPKGVPDVVVLTKHDSLNPLIAKKCREEGIKVVFDVCDDHFENPKLAKIYMDTIHSANHVTTVTEHHAERIWDFTGVKATVIEDPYEWPEQLPKRPTDKLFWFGMPKNWAGLLEVLPKLHGYNILCVGDSSHDSRIVQWSWEAMAQGFKEAGLALLPHPKVGNSPDRVVDAIRNGLYVISTPWPEAEHLGMWHGDVKEGVEWALDNQQKAKKAVKKAQLLVAERYSPEKIARDWETIFKWKAEIY